MSFLLPSSQLHPSEDARYTVQLGLRNAVIAALIGLVGVVMMIFTNIALAGALAQGVVMINDPANVEGDVPRVVKLQGTAYLRPDASKAHLVIVVELPDGTVYPQGIATIKKDHTYTCLISLGEVKSKQDADYMVRAVLVDTVGAQAIQKFVTKNLRTSKTGMTNFPTAEHLSYVGTRRLHRVVKMRAALKRPHPEHGCSK